LLGREGGGAISAPFLLENDMPKFDDTSERYVDIWKVPVGTYLKRKADSKKIYIAAGYCPVNRGYQIDDAGDINRALFLRGDKKVFVGFTY
jgi:hypothetical protein